MGRCEGDRGGIYEGEVMGNEGVRRQRVMAQYFCKIGEGFQGVTWERGEEEIEGWLVLMLDHKGEEDGWALTHGES